MSDTVSAAVIATSQDDRIRQRAYEIWENEGRTDNPEDHWFRAEQELADQRQERSDATVGDAPPAAGAEVSSAAIGEIPDERMAEVAHHALPAEFRRVDPHATRVILIEAGPRLLPTFPEDLSTYAQRALERMGVEVMTSTRVTNCDEQGIDLEGSRIEAGTLVWAAGVVASQAAEWIGAERDRAERVKVGPDLTVPGRPEIFVVGDIAAAKQMGRYVAGVIAARVANRHSPGPFRYRHQGDLATIGRRAAVVKLDHMHLKGFLGWLFWGFAHVYFLISLRNRAVVALNWFWNYLTYQRGARLIVDGPGAQEAAQAEKTKPLASSVEMSRSTDRSQVNMAGQDWR